MPDVFGRTRDARTIEVVMAAQQFRRPLTIYWDSRERRHSCRRRTTASPRRWRQRTCRCLAICLRSIRSGWATVHFSTLTACAFPLCLRRDGARDRHGRNGRRDGAGGNARDFWAAGLDVGAVADAIASIKARLGPDGAWGVNLIHSPDAPGLEETLVDLYLREGVVRVSASAFLSLSPAIIRYIATGCIAIARGAHCAAIACLRSCRDRESPNSSCRRRLRPCCGNWSRQGD